MKKWIGITGLFLASCSLIGCASLHYREEEDEPEPTPESRQPEPFVPLTIQKTLEKPTTQTTMAEDARLQNPEAFGEAARLAVGRTFAPVYFEPNSADLTGEGRRTLTEIASWLRANPHVWAALAGHTSTLGGLAYNFNLGMARAVTVQQFLRDQGLDSRKFYPIGYGPELPAEHNPAAQAQEKNDRVEVLGFVAPPGVNLPPAVSGSETAPEIENAIAEGHGTDAPLEEPQ